MHGQILLNLSKEFIYLIIYRNNKYRQQLTLVFLLLPVICYRPVFGDYEIWYRRNRISEKAVFHALLVCPHLFIGHKKTDLPEISEQIIFIHLQIDRTNPFLLFIVRVVYSTFAPENFTYLIFFPEVIFGSFHSPSSTQIVDFA